VLLTVHKTYILSGILIKQTGLCVYIQEWKRRSQDIVLIHKTSRHVDSLKLLYLLSRLGIYIVQIYLLHRHPGAVCASQSGVIGYL
jgi:hypothetical protein